MKKHLNIVGTIYRGDLSQMDDIWVVAVWLTDLHIAAHPLNAEDEAWGDGPDEREQSEHEPSEALSDSSQCPADSSGGEELADAD